jgi:hypothetical protein
MGIRLSWPISPLVVPEARFCPTSELPTNHELACFVITRAFLGTNVGCRLKSLLDKRVGLKTAAEPSVIDPVRRVSSKATIRPGDESAI